MTPADGLTFPELVRLSGSRSEEEWGQACDAVKHARGGEYPHDWFLKVIVTGLLTMVKAQWVKA